MKQNWNGLRSVQVIVVWMNQCDCQDVEQHNTGLLAGASAAVEGRRQHSMARSDVDIRVPVRCERG